ncbi:MAG: polysulfide reductase NrfD [Fibrobacteria bacterium]|nr:polysulfide reductase NrfD [Fibrobacteria bacterium]
MYFIEFIKGSVKQVTTGNKYYWAWVVFLCLLIVIGTIAYINQMVSGLLVTSMRDQVPWGMYIGNFTFLVGVAAAAVVLVIPAYIYNWGPIKEIVIFGELLAISAIIMCIGFVVVDVGHPERVWHMLPLLGTMNFPSSLLCWDVVVLNMYFLLNFSIATYLLYKAFMREDYNHKLVTPLVLFSIPMAVSIHTVTAFLYNGLAARPFWNASILAPRFLASAFCSGPAIMIILFQVLRKTTKFKIKDEAIWKVAELMAYAMGFNLFLLIAEVFKEFYSDTHHLVHTKFMLFGYHGHHNIVMFTWFAIFASVAAFIIFVIPSTRKNFLTLNVGCILIYFGVYIEKGVGLIIPGLTPDVLGEIYEYTPSNTEIFVSMGIFSLGFLIFTLMMKVAVPITRGEFHSSRVSVSQE